MGIVEKISIYSNTAEVGHTTLLPFSSSSFHMCGHGHGGFLLYLSLVMQARDDSLEKRMRMIIMICGKMNIWFDVSRCDASILAVQTLQISNPRNISTHHCCPLWLLDLKESIIRNQSKLRKGESKTSETQQIYMPRVKPYFSLNIMKRLTYLAPIQPWSPWSMTLT